MTYDPTSYWTDRLSREWSLQGVGHHDYSRFYNHFLYKAKVRALRRELRRFAVDLRGRDILDIGSGVGFWLAWFEEAGAGSLTGIEISPHAAARLRERFPKASVWATDVSADWPFDHTFDVVNAFDILYHVTDRERFGSALRQIAGRLRPGGYFFATDLLGPRDIRYAEHVQFRGLDTYRALLEPAGCEVVGAFPLFGLLNGMTFDAVFGRRGPMRRIARLLEEGFAPILYAIDGLFIPAHVSNLRLLVARRPGAAAGRA